LVLALQRQHERIANQKRDDLRMIVFDLVQWNDLIAVEDL
jgi:hypothetical protein